MRAISPLALGLLGVGLGLLAAGGVTLAGAAAGAGLGVLAGGVIGSLNLAVLVGFLRMLAGTEVHGLWAVVFSLKLGVLAVALVVCIRVAHLPGWSLAAGVSASLVALVALMIGAALRSKGADGGEHVG